MHEGGGFGSGGEELDPLSGQGGPPGGGGEYICIPRLGRNIKLRGKFYSYQNTFPNAPCLGYWKSQNFEQCKLEQVVKRYT